MIGNQGLNKCVLAGLLFMALCGATVFAAPAPTFSATARGTTSNLTLTANITIGDADAGQIGNVYLAAYTGSTWFVRNGSSWVSWSGGPLPVYSVGPLTSQSIEVVRNTDLSALVGTQIYVGYGLNENDMLANGKYGLVYTVSATLEANAWTTKASMAAARTGPAAEVINGILYVAGGHNGTRDDPSLQAYNPTTNTWNLLASMPGGRYQGNGAGVINGQLYIAGGWTTSPGLPNNNLWAYDPPTNTWTTKASMPLLSACGATGVINGKLYVITPCNGYSGYQNFLHRYDPVTNSWTSLAPSLNAHSEPAAGVINGKFYVAGGLNGSGVVSSTLEVYDPATNAWNTLTPMPTARTSSAGGVINGKLYAVGGRNGAGAYLNTMEVYDPVTNTWTTEASMPTARAVPAGGVLNGILYVLGGVNASNTGLATNEAYTVSATTTVTASAGDGRVTISWNAVSGATSYNLYMASVPGVTKSNYSTLTGGMKHTNVTSPYIHTGLTNGTTYYFVVTTVNSAGESAESSEVSATPTTTSPYAGTWQLQGTVTAVNTQCSKEPLNTIVTVLFTVDVNGNFVIMDFDYPGYIGMTGNITNNGVLTLTSYGDTLVSHIYNGTCPLGSASGTMSSASAGAGTMTQGGGSWSLILTRIPASPFAGTWQLQGTVTAVNTQCSKEPLNTIVTVLFTVDVNGNFVIMDFDYPGYIGMTGNITNNGVLTLTSYGDTLVSHIYNGTCPLGSASGTMSSASAGAGTLTQGGGSWSLILTRIPASPFAGTWNFSLTFTTAGACDKDVPTNVPAGSAMLVIDAAGNFYTTDPHIGLIGTVTSAGVVNFVGTEGGAECGATGSGTSSANTASGSFNINTGGGTGTWTLTRE